MTIFSNVPPDTGEATLEAAAAALLRRAGEAGFYIPGESFHQTRWSLAELRPDREDFAWLCRWAGSLEAGLVRKRLGDRGWQREIEDQRFTGPEIFGWLLLLLASEAARRAAAPGGPLWPAVRRDADGRLRFRDDVDAILFARGEPAGGYRDALEAAARRLNLRHIFGLEGHSQDPESVQLQYGCSRRTYLHRLPGWLDGQPPPDAVERLIRGRLASATFQSLLVDGFLSFRQGVIEEDALRGQLAESPWVLPEWADELVRCARAESLPQPTDDEPLPILEGPWLRWDPPAPPRFTSHLANLDDLDLGANAYTLLVAGQHCDRLTKKAGGGYVVQNAGETGPSGEFTLPSTGPHLTVNLVADSGEVLAGNLLTLWDPAEDVSVYPLPWGQRLPNAHDYPMSPDQDYLLLLAPDLALAPEGPPPVEVAGQRRLFLLRAGWPADTRVMAGTEVVWQPSIEGGPPPSEPDWAAGVEVARSGHTGEVKLGESVSVLLKHPAGVAVTFVHCGGQPFDPVPRTPEHTRLRQPIPVEPATATGVLNLLIGVRQGDETGRVRRSLEVPVVGGARLEGSTWVVLSGDGALTVDQARRSPFRILPPTRRHGQSLRLSDWAVLEGDTYVCRPRPLPRPLTGLPGLGAALAVRNGPYNSFGSSIPLAREVQDTGLLAEVALQPPEAPRTLHLGLTTNLHPGPGHRIVWWDAAGTVYPDLVPRLLRGGEEAGGAWWGVDLPAEATRPRAVALSDAGSRRGAWWPREWAEGLGQAGGNAVGTATLLRWLRLPVLGPDHLTEVRRYAEGHAGEVLTAWLFDEPPQPPLQSDGADWLPVVREVFRHWEPDLASVDVLLDAADRRASIPAREALTLALMRVDPLLMGRVLRCYVREVYRPRYGTAHLRDFLHSLALIVAQLPEGTPSRALAPRREELLHEIATTMRVSEHFASSMAGDGIKAFNGQPLTDAQAANLAVAISTLEPFRNLLALRIIEAIGRTGNG